MIATLQQPAPWRIVGRIILFRPGLFVEAIETGRWLVIDELNRSNFDRAFGQLFTVLSGSAVVLPYKRKGQADLAITAYKEALRLNPRMADAHLNLGNLYLEREQPRQPSRRCARSAMSRAASRTSSGISAGQTCWVRPSVYLASKS